jgi:hypothetical protein
MHVLRAQGNRPLLDDHAALGSESEESTSNSDSQSHRRIRVPRRLKDMLTQIQTQGIPTSVTDDSIDQDFIDKILEVHEQRIQICMYMMNHIWLPCSLRE